jgi:hypothetical protein
MGGVLMKKYVQALLVTGCLGLMCLGSIYFTANHDIASRNTENKKKSNTQHTPKKDDEYIIFDNEREPVVNLTVEPPEQLVGAPLKRL